MKQLMILPEQSTNPRARMRGHRAMPGSGPEGEKCKTCVNFVRHCMSRTHFKCGLTNWTHGAATDIKANDPACEYWGNNAER